MNDDQEILRLATAVREAGAALNLATQEADAQRKTFNEALAKQADATRKVDEAWFALTDLIYLRKP